ncbi:MAG: pyridoxal-phosphate dependent enzyme [Rhodopirellula sp.]|nr:pyridoxal-phosphate dependent enzyme [Rhodopirellula sp.]
MDASAVDFERVQRAATAIAGVAHRTPVMTCSAIDELAGRRLFFKCENFQKVGAFKFRGAFNAIAQLSDEAATNGVVTHSSGNHAQALALAAKMRGVPAYIVMPSTAPSVKKAAVEGYGAEVIVCEPTLAARESTADAVQIRTGATFIHPYDNDDVIAGQGTAMLELYEQVAELGELLDAVVTPVGGGGLLAGTCIAARGLNSSLRVFAGEPAGADDAARSFEAGRRIPQTAPDTIADGLLTSLGERNWQIIHPIVERILTVSDDEIVAAMRLLWERAKLLVEPSSAVALAAILSRQFEPIAGLRSVGVILSGGNVDLERLPWMRGSLGIAAK